MFRRILPPQIDNQFHGHKVAFWLAIPLVLADTLISFNSLFFPHFIAQHADHYPLDTFSTNAAAAVVLLFALFGLARLILDLLAILTLMRYRAMLPFLYFMLLAEVLARRAVLLLHPIIRSSPSSPIPASAIAYAVLYSLGLFLSLRNRAQPGAPRI